MAGEELQRQMCPTHNESTDGVYGTDDLQRIRRRSVCEGRPRRGLHTRESTALGAKPKKGTRTVCVRRHTDVNGGDRDGARTREIARIVAK